VTRGAPSFLRIGSFEACNPPEELYIYGGGQQPADLEALRVLGEWVVDQVLCIERPEGGAWGRELITESARRNAKMVAGWQAYGFMHGVINTDKYEDFNSLRGCLLIELYSSVSQFLDSLSIMVGDVAQYS